VLENRECPPSTQKMSTTDPLGGDVRGLGASTKNVKNVNGGPPERQCRRSGSANYQCKKCQRWAPWEAVPKVRECPPSTQKTSTTGPLGGGVRGQGGPTINAKNVNGAPLGGGAGGPGESTTNAKKYWRRAHLGGGAGGLRALTINAKNVDGRPPRIGVCPVLL
jgi:hypothetical protein